MGKNNITLQWKVITVELRETWTIARGSVVTKDIVIVTLTNGVHTGYGEAAPISRYNENIKTVIDFLQTVKAEIEDLSTDSPHSFFSVLNTHSDGNHAARCAVDAAFFDFISKSNGITLAKYLSINTEEMPVTSYSIGMDSSDVIKRKVCDGEPFPVLKIKVGTERDREIIDAVRSVTDKPLYVDANEGWKDADTALESISWLAKEGVVLVEQPLPAGQLSEMEKVKVKSPIPVIADEDVMTHKTIPALKKSFHGVNIKLMKTGGISEALKCIETAREHNLKVMIGCMIETGCAITAAANISPLCDYVDLDGNLLLKEDPFSGVTVEGGRLILPDGPGLGITPRIPL